jgi:hypothetical protein
MTRSTKEFELILDTFIEDYKQLAREGMICDENLYCALLKLQQARKKAFPKEMPVIKVANIVSA